MRALTLIPSYLHWHYSRAIIQLLGISKNLILFIWDFFSIGLLVSTLFYPWKRDYIDKDNPDGTTWYERLVFNVVLRCIGAGIRSIFIVIGLASIILLILITAGSVIVWIMLPLVVLVLIILGGAFIISAL